MRILIIGPHPTTQPPIPLIVKRMASGLEESGCTVQVAHYGRHRLGENLRTKIAERTLDAVRLMPLLRRRKFDAVILNTSHDWRALLRDLPLILTLKLSRLPYTFMYHGTIAEKLASGSGIKHKLYKALFGLRLRLSAGAFVLARAEENALREFWPKAGIATVRLPFVPMPRVEAEPQAEESAGPTILYVGRLLREKGSLELLRAFQIVAAKVPCRLVIVGDGPVAEEAHSLAEELNIQDKVRFTGRLEQEEVAKVLATADLFVFPTYYTEGFPVAVLEAMGAGLPVITSPIAGLVDWLTDGVHGRFVSPRNPQLLADTIAPLLEDPQLRAAMGARNIGLVQQFMPQVVMAEYLAWMNRWSRKKKRTSSVSRTASTLETSVNE